MPEKKSVLFIYILGIFNGSHKINKHHVNNWRVSDSWKFWIEQKNAFLQTKVVIENSWHDDNNFCVTIM